jgi:hypothetical protein
MVIFITGEVTRLVPSSMMGPTAMLIYEDPVELARMAAFFPPRQRMPRIGKTTFPGNREEVSGAPEGTRTLTDRRSTTFRAVT